MHDSSHQTSDSPRVALPILGWVLSWLYPFLLVPPLITTATQYSDDAWAVSFFLGVPLAIVSLALIYLGGVSGQRSSFLALPHILTVVLAFTVLPTYFWPSTILGQHLAAVKLGSVVSGSELATPLWHRAFVPAHVLCLAAFAWAALHFRPRLTHEPEANVA